MHAIGDIYENYYITALYINKIFPVKNGAHVKYF